MVYNIFPLLKADPVVRSLLESVEQGSTVLRAYEFGLAPDEPKFPYVTWEMSAADPQNTFDGRSKGSFQVLQIDVWGLSADSCESVAEAVEFAVELEGYVISYRGATKDSDGVYNVGFDFEILHHRMK